jgi:hypothetical protein
MKFRVFEAASNEPGIGDVRRFSLNEGGEMTTFIGIVTGIEEESVRVKRCYKEDPKSSRYQIKDVGAAGLEYAMFVDDKVWRMNKKTMGRKYGMLSKKDLRNVKE